MFEAVAVGWISGASAGLALGLVLGEHLARRRHPPRQGPAVSASVSVEVNNVPDGGVEVELDDGSTGGSGEPDDEDDAPWHRDPDWWKQGRPELPGAGP